MGRPYEALWIVSLINYMPTRINQIFKVNEI